jgi:hypothetical protein
LLFGFCPGPFVHNVIPVGGQANAAAITADANPILLKMLQALLDTAAGAAMPRGE